MPNTTRYNIPYPANTDYVTNGASAMGTIAGAVDDLLAGGQFMGGFRNKLINGNHDINQRGSGTVTTSGAFPVDRWKLFFNAGTYSASRQATDLFGLYVPPFRHYLRNIVAGSSSGTSYSILEQFIEDVYTLAGKTVTASFWARTTVGTAKIGASFDQNFGTGGTPSAEVAGTGVSVTVDTNWKKYSVQLSVPAIISKVLGTNNNDALIFRLWLSATSGLDTRSGSVGVQSKTIDIAGVQLEAGAHATDYELRPRQVELALCQRYTTRLPGLGNTAAFAIIGFGIGRTGSSTIVDFKVPLPTAMRISPTSAEVANLRAEDGGTAYTFGSFTFQTTESAPTAISLTGASGSGITGFRPYNLQVNNNAANGYLLLSAEL